MSQQPQPGASGQSRRVVAPLPHVHHSRMSVNHHHMHSELEIDWETKERELEEARARAAQMEKTMRWWSDCTANWREKWSKVRTERNRSREEAKILRQKLEMAVRDCSSARREKQSVERENEFLRAEVERMMAGQLAVTDDDSAAAVAVQRLVDDNVPAGSYFPPAKVSTDNNDRQPVFSSSDDEVERPATPDIKQKTNEDDDNDDNNDDVDYLQQKLVRWKLRLDEAGKTIQAEREEKSHLHRTMESMQLELLDVKQRLDEVKSVKMEAERLLMSTQESHRQQVNSLRADRRDQAASRETLDRRLAELRAELERLQAENAAEWGRRERLETEKQSLERDNKKLRAAINDLQERMERRGSAGSVTAGSVHGVGGGDGCGDIGKQMHDELEERNKDLLELKHAHNKLKKALQDRSVELGHGLRRAEHSEAEVRRLRSRIEELKREVATAQDELDAATNHVRKLQRTNEELQEQIDSLQLQNAHLQTRLRNSGSSSFLLQDTLSEDDTNDVDF